MQPIFQWENQTEFLIVKSPMEKIKQGTITKWLWRWGCQINCRTPNEVWISNKWCTNTVWVCACPRHCIRLTKRLFVVYLKFPVLYFLNMSSKKNLNESNFPGGSVVKNLLANSGNVFNPWSRKISHATGQLSPCTITTDPVLCN